MTNQLKDRHATGAQKVHDEKMDHVQMQHVYDGIQSQWDREHKAALTALDNDFTTRIEHQEETGARLTSASPYGSLVYALTALSDSGSQSDERFLKDRQFF